MGEKFFDVNHTHMKLDRTICLYSGVPYYIRHNTADDKVLCSPLDGKSRAFYVKYTNDDFDYTHIPLGYCDYRKDTYYLVREPQRINQQGLTTRAIRILGDRQVSPDSIVFSENFIDCVKGVSRDFESAIKMLREGARGVALSRHMAIRRQNLRIYTVDYRGNTVALSQNKGLSFTPVEHDGVHLIIKRLRQHKIPLA